MTVDWTQPIELNDGTPLRVDGLPGIHHIGVRVEGGETNYAAFPIYRNRGSAQISTGLVISNHKFHVRNRIMKKIDTTKPLVFIVPTGEPPIEANFITVTSEGHVLVQAKQEIAGWYIFTADGQFVRSEHGAGTGCKLGNIPEKTCEYVAITASGTPIINNPGYRNRQLAWDQNPEAGHLVQIDKTDGIVTGVGVLKRPS